MNQYAGQLGMTASNFKNATGLPDDEHYSTARDLAILARAIINEFPDYYEWYSVRKFKYDILCKAGQHAYRIRRIGNGKCKSTH